MSKKNLLTFKFSRKLYDHNCIVSAMQEFGGMNNFYVVGSRDFLEISTERFDQRIFFEFVNYALFLTIQAK